MKTQRRHELQTNELAQWLGQRIERLRPYSKAIMGVLILAVLIPVVVYRISLRQERRQEAAWTSYFDATAGGDTEGLLKVPQAYPGTSAALWSMLVVADGRLESGTQQLFQDREAAIDDLRAAAREYESVYQQASESMVRQRALFGMALAFESIGQLDKAANRYEELARQWPESVLGKEAQDRAKRLKNPESRGWYEWFASQQPQLPAGAGPSVSDIPPTLPSSPDITIPEPGQLIRPEDVPTVPTPGLPAESSIPLQQPADPIPPAPPAAPDASGASDQPAQQTADDLPDDSA